MHMYTNLIYATAIYKISTKEISNFFLLPVSVTKKGWESLYFYKKVHKKTADFLNLPTIHLPLAQFCSKPEEAMRGSEDQKWAANMQASLTVFATDFLKNKFLLKRVF